ncbi:MucBP domain-containing protein, partial [Enterococcus sp. CSURQ0835]|uniref:MucBP domain-containing protein n=1 Tax=Enterococcus sp. CSURQ0835 TaxID=2681394 RepID=UPI00190F2968
MSKATKLLALSFLIAPTFLAATVQAEALTTHEEQLNSQPTNVMKPDALNDAAVKKPKTTVTSNKSLNDAVEYTANETEYAAGDQYEGSLHIVNQDGTPISAGSRIIISIPKEAVDYDSWDFSDPNISPLFTVTTSKENSTLTFSFKSDITGKADINIMFSGKVIGAEDNAYPVSAMAQNADGTSAGVTVYNDEIIIPKKVDPTPIYGLLNMFWGVEQSQKQTSSFIGKRPIDLNNIPTGVFSRKTNAVQNFVEINPKNKTSLTNDMHYELAYEINSTKNYGKVAINDFEVLDAQRGGALVPSSAYSVTKEGANKLNFIFKSPAEGGTYGDGTPIINPNSKYIINVTSSATDDGDVYKADSVLQRKEAHSTTPVSEQEFPLNIMFTREGSSNVFPNLKVADKVFNVGELTQENILAKLNKGVTATDPIDGDLTSKIVTNYSDLLKFKDTPGIYQQKVRYSVTNLKGNSSTQPITVAIIDKAKAADLTVSYQDTEGNKIADDIIKSGELGSPYTTEQKVIEGYTFKEVKGNVNGKLTADPQTVTYIYTKDPVQAANVTVNYQDSAGNTIAPNVVKNGNVGDPYTTEQKTIPGYTFKEVEGNVNGKLTADPQTVTYIYTKDPVQAANVTVNYQDSTGNTVAATEVKSGNVGDPYTTEQKTIPGYTFKEVKGNVNGKLTADPQTVTYIYTKDPVQAANVTVNYQDSAGNTVAATEVKSGNVGDPYTTEQKTIPGYTFKEVKGNVNGKLT